jgi:hypothetical protein
MTTSLEEISYAIYLGRRQELDQTQAIRDRAYKEFREAAYMRQDTVELRWATEQDRRASAKYRMEAARDRRRSARNARASKFWAAVAVGAMVATALMRWS